MRVTGVMSRTSLDGIDVASEDTAPCRSNPSKELKHP
jgi:hypothetical protein